MRNRLLAVLVCLAVAAGLAGTAGARTAVAKCSAGGLVIWLNTQGDGAAGSVYYHLEFTNLSGKACTLSGYPGVSATSKGGAQIGSAARRDTSTVKTIQLAPGASATAVLRIVEALNFPRARCLPTTAAGLRVFPPNDTGSGLIPFPFQACAKKGTVVLSVMAVAKS